MLPYNKKLLDNARELRKTMTPEEKRLWYKFLKKLPCNVYRQRIIGNYIVDFYIPEKKVVIEVDGSQHGEQWHRERDCARDEALGTYGIRVLRYSNDLVRNHFDSVVQDILQQIGLAQTL